MSARIGSATGSIVGGVLSSVFRLSTRRNRKFVIPTAPMLMTVPAMIWSTLWRMPSQARRSPTQRRSEHRRSRRRSSDAEKCVAGDEEADARGDRGDAGADQHLALERDVEHAAPLGQDAGERAQRDRRGELEAAAEHAREVGGLPLRSAARMADDPGPDQHAGATAATGRRRRGTSCRTADDPLARRRRRSTARRRSSAIVTRVAALLVDPERERRRASRSSGSRA